jgi:uncharacterized protein (TIGR03435 family)
MGYSLAAGIAVMAATAALAEQTVPSFEVASVKPNKSGDEHGSLKRLPGGRVDAINMAPNRLIAYAWQVPLFLLAGGPDWIATERFDIVAKLAGDPPPVAPGSGTDPLMLAMRTLLIDRFHLKTHLETREVNIYGLVMAHPGGSMGPALRKSTQDCSPQGIQDRRANAPAGSSGPPAVFCGMQMRPGGMGFGGMPLATFATGLTGLLGRTVVDRTGLSGSWDFELAFAVESLAQPAPPAPPGELQLSDPIGPSIFTAVQEQLGLRLQATKGSAEVLVIDSVERPSPE